MVVRSWNVPPLQTPALVEPMRMASEEPKAPTPCLIMLGGSEPGVAGGPKIVGLLKVPPQKPAVASASVQVKAAMPKAGLVCGAVAYVMLWPFRFSVTLSFVITKHVPGALTLFSKI